MKAKSSFVFILLAALMLSVIILNSNGRMAGIIGVDFQGEDIYRAILSNLRHLAMFAMVFILGGVSI